MKNKKTIDDLFKHELHDYKMIPDDEIKNGIDNLRNASEPKIEDKKNKFLLPFFISLFAVIAVVWLFSPSDKTTKRNIQKNNEIKENNLRNKEQYSYSKNDTAINYANDNKNKSVNISVNKGEQKKSEASTNINSLNTSASNSHNKSISKTDKSIFYTKLKSKILARKNTNENKTDVVKEIDEKRSEKQTSSSSTTEENFTDEKQKNIIPFVAMDSSLLILQLNSNFLTIDSQNDSLNKLVSENTFSLNLENVANSESLAKEEDKQKAKSSSSFVEGGFGISLVNQNSADKLLNISVNDSFSLVNPAINSQILYGLNKNNFIAKAGIMYSYRKEQSNYNFIEKTKTTILVDSIVIVGNDTNVYRNIPKDTILNRNVVNNKKTNFTYVQIPLLIGYSYNINKFYIELSGGVIGNYLLISKGNYWDHTKNNSVDYTSKNDSPLKSFYLLYQINAMFGYKLNEKSMVNLSVPYNFSASSIYKSDYFINRKISSTSIQLNYRYTF